MNGSKNEFQFILSLLAEAGFERVEKVIMLKSTNRKLTESFENQAREESPKPLVNPGASDEEPADAITLQTTSDGEYAN